MCKITHKKYCKSLPLAKPDIDESARGRDLYQSYYGDNIDRLIEIKKKFYPGDLFHSPMSVPVKEDTLSDME